MDVLDHLIAEHRRAESIVEVLKRSEAGEQREIRLSELESALAMHMAVEERYVYPLIERYVGTEDETGAENEHDLTREALRQMRRLAQEPGFSAAVEVLSAGLEHHVTEEENEIFPRLRMTAQDDISALGSPEEMEATIKAELMSRRELYAQARQAGVEGRSRMTEDDLRESFIEQEIEAAEDIRRELRGEPD